MPKLFALHLRESYHGLFHAESTASGDTLHVSSLLVIVTEIASDFETVG